MVRPPAFRGFFRRKFDWLRREDGGFPGALSGAYDLKGGRLVGHVVAELPASRKAIEVQILRLKQVVASFPTIPTKDGRIYAFEIPSGELFSPEEIVRETVELRAANPRGDFGPLALAGVTRLELIREHLGIPVQPVFDLDMSRGGNAAGHLGKGWSGPEDHYTWTLDDDSYVIFPTPVTKSLHLLRMRAGVFINNFEERQTLELSMNGEEFAAFTETEAAVQFRELKVDGGLFGGQPQSVLRLHHPNAGRPSDRSTSRDTRRLAFSFSRLALVRVQNAVV